MKIKKNGKTWDEFAPQDLAGDPAGQEQAGKLVRGIRLRLALEKAGMNKEAAQMVLDIWNGKAPRSEESIPVYALYTTPISLTEEEKVVFLEARKLVLGY